MPKTKTADPDRRTLHFDTLDEVLADAEAITAAPHRTVGNWTTGQIFEHVAMAMGFNNHGVDWKLPFPFRIFGWVLKKFGECEKPMKPGLNPPQFVAKRFAPHPDIPTNEALDKLRAEITHAKAHGMPHPSPLFGKLTPKQVTALHCRHAELHFSFIVPDTAKD